MTNVAKALSAFWNSFSIPAYLEDHVPDDAQLPYITYTQVQPDWRESGSTQGRIWYKSNSFVDVNAKVDEIAEVIGEGHSIQTTDGLIVLYKDVNFCQPQPFPEDSKIRVMYLNVIINAYTK